MIAIDLSKQQELDTDPKAIQQITFIGNLHRVENVNDNTIMFSLLKNQKKPSYIFHKEL